MITTTLHGVLQLDFEARAFRDDPLGEVSFRVVFRAPSGRERSVEGYWDGGRDWRVRFSPDEAGTWHWRSVCRPAGDAGLGDRRGSFGVAPYEGDNPLYRHGPLRLSGDGTHLEHADGTPFFWLADTAWNGVIRGDDDAWQRYLDTRRRQGFTAVQFVLPHWRGDERDELGEASCTESHPLRVNPAWFQRKDARVSAINAAGLLAAPVVLWTLLPSDLGWTLDESDAIRLARYITARYGAYQVLWLLGGDGDYRKMGADRWRRIGRGVFEAPRDRLVALHPCGLSWIGDDFRGEPWFDVIGYQSGHGDSDGDLRWLTQGPPARQWAGTPALPVINLEPNYESAYGYHRQSQFGAAEVRRAAYWSCLLSPTAGVSYGHDRIWTWNLVSGPCEGHEGWGHGCVEPWHTALDTPGTHSMALLRRFFESLPWWTLRPAPELLASQPGEADPKRFVAASRTGDGRLAVIYAPEGGFTALRTTDSTSPRLAPSWWYDPRTGAQIPAHGTTTPGEGDWVLVMEAVQ